MTDEEFETTVVEALRAMPRAQAVMLGGSRARGDHRPDSDWDFAVYYRGAMDASYFETLGWPGTVYQPGQWGQVMYGGSVFDLDGRHFDVHYRNLDVVEHWTAEALQGRFQIHILNFYLAGVPTYMLTGEMATGRLLWGEIDRPDYPEALRESAPTAWRNRVVPELAYAQYWVNDENPISLAGCLARAVLEEAHARLAGGGIWALNEKRMIRMAGLNDLFQVFSQVGSRREQMAETLEQVRRALLEGD